MGEQRSHRRSLRIAAAVAVAAVATTLALAAAPGNFAGERLVLHERVEGLAAFRWDPGGARPDPSTVLAMPPRTPGAAAAGPVGSDDGPATDGPGQPEPIGLEPPTAEPALPPTPGGRISENPSESFAPDLETNSHSLPERGTPPGILWNPAPGPYLRQQVYDTVRDDGVLDAPPEADLALRELEAPTGATGHERFLGRARLEVRDRAPVRIPSPAPEFRAAISGGAATGDRLAIDRAGNLFLLPGPTSGTRELVLSLETDARAFGGPLDPTARVADIPDAFRPSFPLELDAAARRVGEALRLSADLPVETLLRLLSAHFRSYRPGPPPAWQPGTDYEQLALGGVGLCRHRAYAFVVTAQALGLPVRMPVSRLHAWVEALVPVDDPGGRRWLWRRIDLGGAYGQPDETQADLPAHVPDLPDPFAWPRGARPTPAGLFPGPGPGTGGTTPGSLAAVDGPLGDPVPGSGTPTVPAPQPPPATPPGTPTTPPGTPPATGPTSPPGTPPVAATPWSPPAGAGAATLERFPFDATRGDAIDVAGRSAGDAPPGALAQIVLEQPGAAPRELGALAVIRGGRFGGTVTIPGDVVPGDYVLRAYIVP